MPPTLQYLGYATAVYFLFEQNFIALATIENRLSVTPYGIGGGVVLCCKLFDQCSSFRCSSCCTNQLVDKHHPHVVPATNHCTVSCSFNLHHVGMGTWVWTHGIPLYSAGDPSLGGLESALSSA